MFRSALAITIAAILVVAASVMFAVTHIPKKSSSPHFDQGTDARESRQTLSLEYYYHNQFFAAQQLATKLESAFPKEKVRSGIIPHDIRQGQFIADFFNHANLDEVSTIVLVGPNHYESGATNVITSSDAWETPFGVIQPNREVIAALVKEGFVTENHDVIQHEHSVAGIIPYIGYLSSSTSVVPLILKYETTSAQLDQLMADLASVLPAHSLVVAPVDFSHYLPPNETAEKDVVTEKALRELDDTTILSFGPRFNDYVDSPPSIAFILRWAKKQGETAVTIVQHTNGALLSGDPVSPTTSYFEVTFTKPE